MHADYERWSSVTQWIVSFGVVLAKVDGAWVEVSPEPTEPHEWLSTLMRAWRAAPADNIDWILRTMCESATALDRSIDTVDLATSSRIAAALLRALETDGTGR
jgi:hypothetical protein